jgi:hypothetical protein
MDHFDTDSFPVDNGTTHVTVSHVFRSDYSGNRGKDMCLETFGEQDAECIAYNEKLK